MKAGIMRAAAIAVLHLASPGLALAADKPNAADAEAKDDPAKFFLFHASGLSADQVRGDLVYCIGMARPILSMRDKMPQQGGLIGAMINGRMAEIDRLRMRNAAMRKCMGMMGYDRYQIPQDQWNAVVNKGDIVLDDDGLVDPQVVERMVVFATGPAPSAGKLPL